jgi:hypothetical protein
MANSKDNQTIKKQKSLYLVLYIITVFVLIILSLDLVLYLLLGRVKRLGTTPAINIQGVSQDLQNQLKNILNQ